MILLILSDAFCPTGLTPQTGCLVCPTQAADFLLSFLFLHHPLPFFLVSGTLFEGQSALVCTLPYFWPPCSDIVQSLSSWVADLPPSWPRGSQGTCPKTVEPRAELPGCPVPGWCPGWGVPGQPREAGLWPRTPLSQRLSACDQTPTARSRGLPAFCESAPAGPGVPAASPGPAVTQLRPGSHEGAKGGQSLTTGPPSGLPVVWASHSTATGFQRDLPKSQCSRRPPERSTVSLSCDSS